MVRTLISVVFAISVLGLGVETSDACSCAEQTPKQYVDGADQVLLARAGADKKTTGRLEQTFDVLYAIKGGSGKSFTWTRTDVSPPCGLAYQEGEVALLFVTKGDLGRCSGNFGLAAQTPHLGAYLAAAGVKTSPASLGAMRTALEAGLAKYLHGRAVVPVHYPALAGRSVKVGTSTLAFRTRQSRAKNAIAIEAAVEAGPLVYVAGRYPIEGYAFHVVALAAPGKDPVVVYVASVER